MRKLISALIVIIGIAILGYPIISNVINEKYQEKAVQDYVKKAALPSEKAKKELLKAKEYNNNLSGTDVQDPFKKNQGYVLSGEYDNLLNIDNGIMATLSIPKIDIRLPIYHGCSEEVLKKGVGHIKGSSLPIGGKSTHCYLSGHRGLPESILFTNLDKLKTGDLFFINVLDKNLAYKVYKTQVVKPSELDVLKPEKNKDLVTLITCTPYGINSHRLLVFGERTTYNPKELNNSTGYQKILFQYKHALIGFGISVFAILAITIIRKIRK